MGGEKGSKGSSCCAPTQESNMNASEDNQYYSQGFDAEDEFGMLVETENEENNLVKLDSPVNYQTYMNKTPRNRWSKQDTQLFYEVMRGVGFNFPIFLDSLFRCLDSSSFLQISLVASYVSSVKDHTLLLSFLSWSYHGLCFCLANTSLKHNSVGFYQMAKIAVTPTIVLAEFVLFKKTISSDYKIHFFTPQFATDDV